MEIEKLLEDLKNLRENKTDFFKLVLENKILRLKK
jgi:hypothetical protein